jgi:DNA replication protein DnaC
MSDNKIKYLPGHYGTSKRILGRTFESFYVETPAELRAVQACREYASRFDEAMETGASFALVGKTNNGKTHLAYSIAMEVAKGGRTVHYTSPIYLLKDLHPEFIALRRVTDEQISQTVEFCLNADLLLIDDVGGGPESDVCAGIIGSIIESRLRDKRPLVVVGYGAEDDLLRSIGTGAFDALKESSGTFIVCDWHITRQRKTAE